jgi:hypothetical protein
MNLRQKWTVAITVCMLALLVACASADAVATFATTSASSLKQGTNVFDDFSASFLRGECNTTITNVELRIEPETQTCIQNLSSPQAADLAKIKEEQQELTDIVNALVAYFDNISTLAGYSGSASKSGGGAGSSKSSTAQNAKTAAVHLQSLGKLNSTQVDAVNSLATFVVKVLSAGYRDRKLQQYLSAANDSIATTTGALQDIVLCDYALPSPRQSCRATSLLSEEVKDLQRQFDLAPKGKIKDEIARYQTDHPESGANETLNPALMKALTERDETLRTLIQESWDNKVLQLQSRDAAAHTYADVLKKVSEGHEQMVKQKTELSAKSLAKTLNTYSSDLQSLAGKLQKAFVP